MKCRTLPAALGVLFFTACSGATGDSRDPAGDDDGKGDETGDDDGPGDGAPEPAAVGQEFACDDGRQRPGPSLVRRLTVAEYLNTVRDVTGVDLTDKAATLPRDHAHDGFTNDARAQSISLDHVEVFATLANEIVKRIPDRNKFLGTFAACTNLTSECESGFVDKLGMRLLRRPPSEAERAALLPLFATVAQDGGTFMEGAELVLLSMLQSPRFLYLLEAQTGGEDGVRPLDDYEMASRLSYLLWGSAPDEELLAAAERGALTEDEGLVAATQRLLDSERSRKHSRVFLSNWLDLGRLDSLQTQVAADMLAETEALFEQVVWQDAAPLSALLNAPFTFASKALATHYQFAEPREGLQRYALDEVPHRRGLLTHGSVLSAGGEDASLVNRGLYVLRNVLCSDVPPPPVGVNNGRPETEPGKPQRWYAEQRTSTKPCDGCHSHLDPLAFPLERFTGLGVARDEDEGGNEIVTDGLLKTPYDEDGKDFADAIEFADLLAADPRVADCMILKPAQFAFARAIDATDACTLAAVKDAAAGGDGARLQDVWRHLVLQPGFRQVQAE